jgi:formate dehydrogenase subunit gamma
MGHISYAMRDPGARRGMRTGSVTARWARTYHAAWAEEVLPPEPRPEVEVSVELSQE